MFFDAKWRIVQIINKQKNIFNAPAIFLKIKTVTRKLDWIDDCSELDFQNKQVCKPF